MILQNEAKEQKGGFLSTLLGTLGGSLLGNILAGKGIDKEKDVLEPVVDPQSKTRIFNTTSSFN